MERTTFYSSFDHATKLCREFSQQFVVEPLPPQCVFDFAAAKRPLGINGKVKFLGGRLLTTDELLNVDPSKAREYLWIDRKVPCWINFSVRSADAHFTHIHVIASTNLSADEADYYHMQEGNPPFHVLGPPVPPGWIDLQNSGKFSVHWHSERHKSS